jgi:hypothetical protein
MSLSGCSPQLSLLAYSLDQLALVLVGEGNNLQTFQARVDVVVTSLTVALSSNTGMDNTQQT